MQMCMRVGFLHILSPLPASFDTRSTEEPMLGLCYNCVFLLPSHGSLWTRPLCTSQNLPTAHLINFSTIQHSLIDKEHFSLKLFTMGLTNKQILSVFKDNGLHHPSTLVLEKHFSSLMGHELWFCRVHFSSANSSVRAFSIFSHRGNREIQSAQHTRILACGKRTKQSYYNFTAQLIFFLFKRCELDF